MAEVTNPSEEQVRSTLINKSQRLVLVAELTNIKSMTHEIRRPMLEIIDLEKDRGEIFFHEDTTKITDQLKGICATYLRIRQSLDRILQLPTSEPLLSKIQLEKVTEILRPWVKVAIKIRSVLSNANDEHTRRLVKVRHRLPLSWTEQKYREAVSQGEQKLIDVWEKNMVKTHGAVNGLSALKDCDEVLESLDKRLNEVLTRIPRLEDYVAKEDDEAPEAQDTVEKDEGNLDKE